MCETIQRLFKGNKSTSVLFFKKRDFYFFLSLKGFSNPYLTYARSQKRESYARWQLIHQKLKQSCAPLLKERIHFFTSKTEIEKVVSRKS